MDRIRALFPPDRRLPDPHGSPTALLWLAPGRLRVTFRDTHTHDLHLSLHGPRLRLHAALLSPDQVQAIGRARVARMALARNRTTEVVGFRLDEAGALVAWVSTPIETLQREELWVYAVRVVVEGEAFGGVLVGEGGGPELQHDVGTQDDG